MQDSRKKEVVSSAEEVKILHDIAPLSFAIIHPYFERRKIFAWHCASCPALWASPLIILLATISTNRNYYCSQVILSEKREIFCLALRHKALPSSTSTMRGGRDLHLVRLSELCHYFYYNKQELLFASGALWKKRCILHAIAPHVQLSELCHYALANHLVNNRRN